MSRSYRAAYVKLARLLGARVAATDSDAAITFQLRHVRTRAHLRADELVMGAAGALPFVFDRGYWHNLNEIVGGLCVSALVGSPPYGVSDAVAQEIHRGPP